MRISKGCGRELMSRSEHSNVNDVVAKWRFLMCGFLRIFWDSETIWLPNLLGAKNFLGRMLRKFSLIGAHSRELNTVKFKKFERKEFPTYMVYIY